MIGGLLDDTYPCIRKAAVQGQDMGMSPVLDRHFGRQNQMQRGYLIFSHQ